MWTSGRQLVDNSVDQQNTLALGKWVRVVVCRSRWRTRRRNMSRQQQPQGVVLTGYHSNLESLPKTELLPPDRPASPVPEPNAPRWVNSCCLYRERRGSAREQRSLGGLGLYALPSVFSTRTWAGSFQPNLHVGEVFILFLLRSSHLSAYLHVNLDFTSPYHWHIPSKAPRGRGATLCSIRMWTVNL